ncbi:MAG: hypothetical protein PHV34_19675, partial [Verrucomicrobiae bacterium]|nr:hypothetical protein [Verrucomicrobiae bacterium]
WTGFHWRSCRCELACLDGVGFYVHGSPLSPDAFERGGFGTAVTLVSFLNEAVEKGNISREAYEKICYKNAERLLGISVS